MSGSRQGEQRIVGWGKGGGAKTNKQKDKYNMLVNKRIRRKGHGEIAFLCWGSVDLRGSILLCM